MPVSHVRHFRCCKNVRTERSVTRNNFPGGQFVKRSVCNTEQQNTDKKNDSIYVGVIKVWRGRRGLREREEGSKSAM